MFNLIYNIRKERSILYFSSTKKQKIKKKRNYRIIKLNFYEIKMYVWENYIFCRKNMILVDLWFEMYNTTKLLPL